LFAKASANPAAVTIRVYIPATTEYTDSQASAKEMFENTPNLTGVFCSNEGTVTGLLSATNDGKDLDRENGIYKHITVVGFDAGIAQKQAVRKQYFYGSITQDPYRIGYLAVELAYKAIKGETVDAVVDTGCKFYNYENIDDRDISQLVYD
jgi:ribose transport system substrate-binding protein